MIKDSKSFLWDKKGFVTERYERMCNFSSTGSARRGGVGVVFVEVGGRG